MNCPSMPLARSSSIKSRACARPARRRRRDPDPAPARPGQARRLPYAGFLSSFGVQCWRRSASMNPPKADARPSAFWTAAARSASRHSLLFQSASQTVRRANRQECCSTFQHRSSPGRRLRLDRLAPSESAVASDLPAQSKIAWDGRRCLARGRTVAPDIFIIGVAILGGL